ncbi:CCA tRNA nucleotidyltransferase [uncultured Sphingomonas sp.]|uniref:CCA tRNA nucleotidyltransferase n=1 Tax=uncultured Sphingomonas sp. TaxID=158754 RepID=UPI0025EC11AE|nr:CCA tRNA nucleotidyltransferase [uncultured Sphingomonas sp.]
MILPNMPWRQRAGLDRLIAALGGAAGEVRYVGGAVRDTVLGLPVSDLDLATIHPPQVVMQRVQAAGLTAVPTGIAHGTVTVVLGNEPVEVTTLRRDVATDGRHAEVAFTDDWQADAARRDFTINALFADPVSGAIVDYFQGLADLDSGVVRFIGDPLVRIAEDHLRILRFFRFHARFGRAAPDAAGLAACAARARDLMALSRERIAQELLKLLAVADPVPTARLMVDHGIFLPVLPEITGHGVEQLARLVRREGEGDGGDAVRRLAALLPHDSAVAEAVACRLKLSNAQRKRMMLAAEPTIDAAPRTLAHAIGVEAARDRLLLHAPPTALEDALAQLRGWTLPRFPLTGGQLIALGLSPGPIVARTLQAIERQWVAEGFPEAERTGELARNAVAQALR